MVSLPWSLTLDVLLSLGVNEPLQWKLQFDVTCKQTLETVFQCYICFLSHPVRVVGWVFASAWGAETGVVARGHGTTGDIRIRRDHLRQLRQQDSSTFKTIIHSYPGIWILNLGLCNHLYETLVKLLWGHLPFTTFSSYLRNRSIPLQGHRLKEGSNVHVCW